MNGCWYVFSYSIFQTYYFVQMKKRESESRRKYEKANEKHLLGLAGRVGRNRRGVLFRRAGTRRQRVRFLDQRRARVSKHAAVCPAHGWRRTGRCRWPIEREFPVIVAQLSCCWNVTLLLLYISSFFISIPNATFLFLFLIFPVTGGWPNNGNKRCQHKGHGSRWCHRADKSRAYCSFGR